MIETRFQPIGCVVAQGTISRELGRDVPFGSVVLNLVARNTFGLGGGDRSEVAIGTLNDRRMSARQCKTGGGMIKRRRLPCRGGVATFTIYRKTGLGMTWSLGIGIIGLVATFALGWSSCKSRSVASGTVHRSVGTG